MMQREIRKRAQTYGITAVIFAILLGVLCYNFGVNPFQAFLPMPESVSASPHSLLSRFSSYEELKSFLQRNSRTQGPYQLYGPWDNILMSPVMKSSALEGIPSYTSGITDNQHSLTNVQVAGVDEADIVKNDGQYVYVLSNRNVYILIAYPPMSAQILSKISFDDTTPVGIYVSGDRLAVLGCKYGYSSSTYMFLPYSLKPYFVAPYLVSVETFVNVYDISDRTKPTLLQDLKLTGSYFSSRMMGDYIYFITAESAYVINNDTTVLPEFNSHGESKEIAPTEICYVNGSDNYFQYTTFVAMNIQNVTEAPTYMTILLGGTSTMYMSLENMYVTFHDWQGSTSIYRLRVTNKDVVFEANGTVPGEEINQFSMDEYNNHFRIATRNWVNGSQESRLYVLDMNLSIVGRLENIAPGETLDSTRFIDDRCYLSTSVVRRDPFFVIDLQNASDPKILGDLKIPGFTSYLHPYDDDHVIGVGRNGSALKISLFDVTNVSQPIEMSNYVVDGDWSDSIALTDPKAFLFERSKDLLVMPVSTSDWKQSQLLWQGAYVFNVTLNNGLLLKGNVTHTGPTSYLNEDYSVKRTLYIEDVLYTVSNKKVKMNSLNDLALIGEIELP